MSEYEAVIEISREPVELFKIIKFENLQSTGGQAKSVIADGLVKVNGKVETQKRKKIKDGDTLEFVGKTYLIKLV